MASGPNHNCKKGGGVKTKCPESANRLQDMTDFMTVNKYKWSLQAYCSSFIVVMDSKKLLAYGLLQGIIILSNQR